MITLEATQRTGSPDQLRAQDLIPAVYYGAGKDAVSIAISARDFAKIWKEAGETTAVTLTIGSEKIPTLIHDIQRDAVSGDALHVDFLVIDLKKEIEVAVPLEFTGTAEAEKNGLGTLVKVVHEVQVSALPANLPHSLEVDVSGLETLDAQIHVKDIKLPHGVTMVTDGEEVVAAMAAFVEETEEPTAAPDLSSIEVEKKGKQDEEQDGE